MSYGYYDGSSGGSYGAYASQMAYNGQQAGAYAETGFSSGEAESQSKTRKARKSSRKSSKTRARRHQSVGDIDEYLSQIEQEIINSSKPIRVKGTKEITINGESGIWVNEKESDSFRGEMSLDKYKIHEDKHPKVIVKRNNERVEYTQEIGVRYLQPPSGRGAQIVVEQEGDTSVGAAPPIIIRQEAHRPATPEPLVVREEPPKMSVLGGKRVTIPGRCVPPPPRKFIVEKLAPLPDKPQNVIVERWLPVKKQKIEVVYKPAARLASAEAPQNIIVKWESAEVTVKNKVNNLGLVDVDPAEYINKYGRSLKKYRDFPSIVKGIAVPREVGTLAADTRDEPEFELTGALDALKYINLDEVGLSQFRPQLLKAGIRDLGAR